jgi:hypothetical protein
MTQHAFLRAPRVTVVNRIETTRAGLDRDHGYDDAS